MITTKPIIQINKYGLRLNHPGTTGLLRKLDRWMFDYKKSKGLPCFLPTPEIKKQLMVNKERIFSGGGVSCFNEPVKIYPVTINKKELNHCKEAYKTKTFKIRNFEYNGFMGRELPGYNNYTCTVDSLSLTNDPGIWYCEINNKHIPEYAIEGIQILFKPKCNNDIPVLFGQPSN